MRGVQATCLVKCLVCKYRSQPLQLGKARSALPNPLAGFEGHFVAGERQVNREGREGKERGGRDGKNAIPEINVWLRLVDRCLLTLLTAFGGRHESVQCERRRMTPRFDSWWRHCRFCHCLWPSSCRRSL